MSRLIEWYRGYTHRREEAFLAEWERRRTKGRILILARIFLIFGGLVVVMQLPLQYFFNDAIDIEFSGTLAAVVVLTTIAMSILLWWINEFKLRKRNTPDTGGE